MMLIAAACAGAEIDPQQTLERLREIARDEAARIPNYTCVQTIDRQFFRPGGVVGSTVVASGIGRGSVMAAARTRPQSCDEVAARQGQRGYHLAPVSADRFRLEVRVGRGGEMYSWVGASAFGDRPLHELLAPGPSGTGAIGPLLMNVVEDAPEFQFDGEKTVNGRRLYAWSFRIPMERSHAIFIEWGGSEAAVAYEGTILAEPETGTPVQLTVVAARLPAETSCCRFTTVLDYSPQRIGAADFPLPQAARQRFTMPDGMEVENTVTFSACREYLAESTVDYQGAPALAVATLDAAPPPRIPGGLPVVIALTGSIDSAVAAAGDPFTGRLVKPVLDKLKNAIAPAGAIVHGRIASSSRSVSPAVNLRLTVETVEIGGREVPFHLTAKPPPGARLPPGGTLGGVLQSRGVPIGELPQVRQEGSLDVHRFVKRLVLRDGFATEWVTVGQP
jgi:hypothetical protein